MLAVSSVIRRASVSSNLERVDAVSALLARFYGEPRLGLDEAFCSVDYDVCSVTHDTHVRVSVLGVRVVAHEGGVFVKCRRERDGV